MHDMHLIINKHHSNIALSCDPLSSAISRSSSQYALVCMAMRRRMHAMRLIILMQPSRYVQLLRLMNEQRGWQVGPVLLQCMACQKG